MKRFVFLIVTLLSVACVFAEEFTLRDAVLWQGKKGIGAVLPSVDGESYYQLRGGDKVV